MNAPLKEYCKNYQLYHVKFLYFFALNKCHSILLNLFFYIFLSNKDVLKISC